MLVKIQLHKAQHDFRYSEAIYRGFVGGRGGGKSFIGAYDLLRRALPGRLYGLYAPTYPLLRDTSLRSLVEVAKQLHFLKDFKKSDGIITLGNNAEIICRSLEEPERARGPNLSGAWIDEASLIPDMGFKIIIAALREQGEQGWLSATFTPKGRQHWTYDVFGKGDDPRVEIFHARTSDNPFLPDGFEDMLTKQYTSAFAAQELGGEFVDMEGSLFRRSWFKIVKDYPKDARLCRYWDMAATEPKKGRDPDWTAGALIGMAEGQYYLIDMRRVQFTPKKSQDLILQTAHTDGSTTPVRMEQEPGASGATMIDHYARHVLRGFDFKGIRPTGPKEVRANPVAAAAEAGNLMLVDGPWIKDFLDEAEVFPHGKHDDQIDALSGASSELGLHFISPSVMAGRIESPIEEKIESELEDVFAGMSPIEKIAATKLRDKEGL